jgi:hypothetical protein
MLHYGAGYTRLHQSDGVFGWETKLSKVDMINCFYFVSFVSSPCFFLFFLFHLSISRAQLFEICAVMVGYSDFLDGVLCLQLVSMILLSGWSAVFINDYRECA